MMRDLEVGEKVLATKDDGQLFSDEVAFFGHRIAGECGPSTCWEHCSVTFCF